jgi:hypothetical protein
VSMRTRRTRAEADAMAQTLRELRAAHPRWTLGQIGTAVNMSPVNVAHYLGRRDKPKAQIEDAKAVRLLRAIVLGNFEQMCAAVDEAKLLIRRTP